MKAGCGSETTQENPADEPPGSLSAREVVALLDDFAMQVDIGAFDFGFFLDP